MLKDLQAILETWPVWKGMKATPERVDALEARVRHLETALTAKPADTRPACPKCGTGRHSDPPCAPLRAARRKSALSTLIRLSMLLGRQLPDAICRSDGSGTPLNRSSSARYPRGPVNCCASSDRIDSVGV